MRLLFVTANKYLPELWGGIEVNTHELAGALLERKEVVGVLCGLAGIGMIGLRARIKGKVWRDECALDNRLGYPVWRSYDPVAQVGRVAQSFRPDIIVVQGGYDFDPLVGACLRLGIPVVCYLHTQDRLLLDQISQAGRLRFIANSHYVKSMHPEKKFSGVVRPLMMPEKYRTWTSRSSAVFVNPAPYKGLDIVLGLAKSRRDVDFLFVINRRQAGVFNKALWKNLPNVRPIGPVNDMRRIYRRAKLLLVPSLVCETWGRVVTEAHFSGIPVLASDRGSLPESVGPGGICVAGDAPVERWLEAFSSIWDSAEQYKCLSEAAIAYSERTEILYEFVANSFLDIINSCLHETPSDDVVVVESVP